MANWAQTDYVIEGPEDILDRIEKAIEKHGVRLDSSDNWEGNILDTLGIEFENDNNYMRGFIEDSTRLSDKSLSLYAEEAWGPTDFSHVLENNLPVKVYFQVEEPGCEVYATNDKDGKHFPDRYVIDMNYYGNWDTEYFHRKEDVMEYIRNRTDGKICTEEDIDKFNEEHETGDDFISIHEVEIVD